MTSAEVILIAPSYQNPAAIVGDVMRELTALEIDQLDFSGKVPEMNMPVRHSSAAAPAKKSQSKYSLKANPFAKRPQLGVARTA